MISGPSQEARIHSRSAMVMVGSNSLSSRSATVPDHSRAPATGTSTVSMSASYPAALARDMRSSPAERSFHTYSWNHLRASGPAFATSSIEVVPIVDSAYGMPRR
jgi:hypothetical protein